MKGKFNWKDFLTEGLNFAQREEARIEDHRYKNRTAAVVIVGSILGFALNEDDINFVLIMSIFALVISCAFWYQDYRFHRFRHGWHGIIKRIRRFIVGQIGEEEVRLLEYDKEDEKKATLICRSSGMIFLVLLLGPIFIAIYKYIKIVLLQE